MFNTQPWPLRAALTLAILYLSACGKSTPPEIATLILKKDGSQFTGQVVRREKTSITLTGAGGVTHTYLWTEIAKITSHAQDEPADGSGNAKGTASARTSAVRGSGSPSIPVRTDVVTPADGIIQFPAGTEFPILSDGFIDSCCATQNFVVVGILEKDIRNSKGEVLIPQNSTFVITLADSKTIDGRLVMTFALASAEFGGRHYGITALGGISESGALATFAGAKTGSPEAAKRGISIHVDDRSLIHFKAANPVVFKAQP